MASAVFAFAGWSFLPNFATTNLQSFYYNITIRAGESKPRPGSPTWVKHRRIIHTLVIVAYLIYTLIEADWEIRRAGDFYRDLGVPHNVDERTLQSRFRRLTLLHHPDKITNPAARPAAEQLYIHLTLAKDTLLDPARRFAYDRFGSDVTRWQGCKTIRDFLVVGARSTLPYYTGSSIVMLVMGFLGFFEWGRYWRYIAFTSLAVFEFHTITRSAFPALPPSILSPLISYLVGKGYMVPYLPFQTLQFAHKAIITLFIALNHLGPVLQPPSSVGASPNAEVAVSQQLSRVEQIVGVNQAIAMQLLSLEAVPFRAEDRDLHGVGARDASGQPSAAGPSVRNLAEKLKEWLVLSEVRQQPEVRDAVSSVVRRRTAASDG